MKNCCRTAGNLNRIKNWYGIQRTLTFYIEEEVVVEKNNEKQTVKRLVIDNSKKSEFLQLSKAFDVIGYFNVSDVLAGKTKQALTGLFT